MQLHDTLIDLLADVRSSARHIRFIDGEKEESVVSYASLWDRAVTLLGALQARGMQPVERELCDRVLGGHTRRNRPGSRRGRHQ